MDVIDGSAPADLTSPPPAPVCVFLPLRASDRAAEVAKWLGADVQAAEQVRHLRHRRPLSHVEDGQISVLAFGTDDQGEPIEVHLHTGDRGLLVVCPDEAIESIKTAVGPVEGAPEDALAAVLVTLARLSDEAIHTLSELGIAFDQSTMGLSSETERRQISRLRGKLFTLQQLWTAHGQMLAPDDILAEALRDGARRKLRRARGIFESSSTAAAQLYAMLGDTLARHSTVISERLTLVTVLFLPLTVTTGFFGMNFGWMTDHIGSAAAFVVLGIVMPCVLVLVTVLGTRRLGGG